MKSLNLIFDYWLKWKSQNLNKLFGKVVMKLALVFTSTMVLMCFFKNQITDHQIACSLSVLL